VAIPQSEGVEGQTKEKVNWSFGKGTDILSLTVALIEAYAYGSNKSTM